MTERVRGMTFEIDVDASGAESKLRRVERGASRAMDGAGAAGKRAAVGTEAFNASLVRTNAIAGKTAATATTAAVAMDRWGRSIEQLGYRISAFGLSMAIGIGIPLAAMAGYAVKASIDFEDSFRGIRKTVDATEQQFRQLEHTMRQLAAGPEAIPVDVNKLNKIGQIAGQLNVSVPYIAEFTKVIAGLGVATNLTLEEAASNLARLRNIMGSAEADYSRLASVIVELGNNFATTESEMLDMALRLAGAGRIIELTEAQVLAFATALRAVGIHAEKGGTAFSRVFVRIGQAVSEQNEKLGIFARVAQTSVAGFVKLFEKDASRAVLAFVKGLRELERAEAFRTLIALQFSNVRVRDALLLSSAAVGELERALVTAEKEWIVNMAATREAERAFSTTKKQLVVVKNVVRDVAITLGDDLKPTVLAVAQAAGRLTRSFEDVPAGARNMLFVTGAVTFALTGLIALLGFLVKAVGHAAATVGGLAVKLGIYTGVTAAASKGTITAAASISQLGGSATYAASQVTIFNGSLGALVATGKLTAGMIAGIAAAVGVLTYTITRFILNATGWDKLITEGIESIISALTGADADRAVQRLDDLNLRLRILRKTSSGGAIVKIEDDLSRLQVPAEVSNSLRELVDYFDQMQPQIDLEGFVPDDDLDVIREGIRPISVPLLLSGLEGVQKALASVEDSETVATILADVGPALASVENFRDEIRLTRRDMIDAAMAAGEFGTQLAKLGVPDDVAEDLRDVIERLQQESAIDLSNLLSPQALATIADRAEPLTIPVVLSGIDAAHAALAQLEGTETATTVIADVAPAIKALDEYRAEVERTQAEMLGAARASREVGEILSTMHVPVEVADNLRHVASRLKELQYVYPDLNLAESVSKETMAVIQDNVRPITVPVLLEGVEGIREQLDALPDKKTVSVILSEFGPALDEFGLIEEGVKALRTGLSSLNSREMEEFRRQWENVNKSTGTFTDLAVSMFGALDEVLRDVEQFDDSILKDAYAKLLEAELKLKEIRELRDDPKKAKAYFAAMHERLARARQEAESLAYILEPFQDAQFIDLPSLDIGDLGLHPEIVGGTVAELDRMQTIMMGLSEYDLDPVAQQLLDVNKEAGNLTASMDVLNFQFDRGTITQDEYIERAGVVAQKMIDLAQIGGDLTVQQLDHAYELVEALQAQEAAMHEVEAAAFATGVRYELLGNVLQGVSQALWQMAVTGDFSARAMAHAIAQQVYATLSALAIEALVRGWMETALAIATLGTPASAHHAAAASVFFKTAALAGAGAAAALAIGAATAPARAPGAERPESPDTDMRQQDGGPGLQVTFVIEGESYIMDPDEFFQDAIDRIRQLQNRSGS